MSSRFLLRDSWWGRSPNQQSRDRNRERIEIESGFAAQLPVQALRESVQWLGRLASSWRNVERGCPQGSVLGPLLWNMFQNDLSNNVNSALSMYADEHQIYEKEQNMCTVLAKLQESATLATNWYDSNLLRETWRNIKRWAFGIKVWPVATKWGARI